MGGSQQRKTVGLVVKLRQVSRNFSRPRFPLRMGSPKLYCSVLVQRELEFASD
jgi:hypothetical protein